MSKTPSVKVVVLPRPRRPRVDASSLVSLAGRSRHALAGLVALSIGTGLLGGPFVLSASAAPAVPGWSATSSATLAKVGITAVGLNLAAVGVGPASGSSDGVSAKRVVADVNTLAADIAGLSVPVSVAHQEGPADNPVPVSNGVGANVAGGLLNVSAIKGSAGARWGGDAICLPSGTNLTSTTTDTLGLGVGSLLNTGALKSSTSTGFTASSDARHTGVTASATTESVDVTLTNGIVVHVPRQVATVSADGTTGGATAEFTDSAPTITVGGNTTTLTKGQPRNLTPALGTTIAVKYNGATRAPGADGRSASVTSPGLLTVSVNVLGLAATTVDLFPVNAAVTAPAGGIDCVVPAPVISAPVTGTVVNSLSVPLTGTGIPGAVVTVKSGSATVGTATVSPTGTWSTTATLPSDGAATLTATQTSYERTSGASNAVALTVDSTLPDRPVITSPVQDETVKAVTYQLTGTAEAGSAVTVANGPGAGATTFGPVTAGADGSWTVLVTLAEGVNTFTATAEDAAGNVSVASAAWTITADNTAPVQPVVLAPTSGTVTKVNTPVISGTAEPLSSLTVLTSSGGTLGTLSADADGNWSMTPASALPEGPTGIVVLSSDAAGNQTSSDSVLVTVDTQAPAAPKVTTPQDGSTGSTVPVSVTGTGEPGAKVTVTVDDDPFGGVVEVDNSGHWTVVATLPATAGQHTLVATQTDAALNTSAATTTTYTVAPAANAVSIPVLDQPEETSLVAANTIGGTVVAPAAGDAVTITVTPAAGTAGGPQILTATLDTATGTFSAPVTLTDGTWILTATHTTSDAATSQPVTSGSSAPVQLLVDLTRPDAPSIDTPVGGQTVATSTPLVTGTAEPGSIVNLTVDGENVGSGRAGTDGRFAIVAGPFDDGAVTITANAVGADERNSDAATRSFVVDALPPTPVTIAAPAAGAVLKGAVTVSGAGADAGATVTVQDELGRVVGTVEAQADGTWSLNAGTFTDGLHTLTAVQADRLARTSPVATVSFTADATAPGAVSIGSPQGSVSVKDTLPVISGAGAEPGNTVTLRTAAGDTLATTDAGADGSFSFSAVPVPAGTTEGPFTVSVVQTDKALNVSAPVAVTLVEDRSAAAPVVLAPTAGSASQNTRPTISGTGEANGSVAVTLGGSTATVPVGVDGTWAHVVPAPLADGNHTVTAVLTDALGNVSAASAPVTFTVDTAALPPVNTSALISDGDVTLTGTSEPLAHIVIRQFAALGEGPVLGEGDADAQGNWTVHPTGLGLLGLYTATQTDPAGNTSLPASGLTLVLEAPATPTVTATATATPTATADPTGTTTATATDQPTATASPTTGPVCGALGVIGLGGLCTTPSPTTTVPTDVPTTTTVPTTVPTTTVPTTVPTTGVPGASPTTTAPVTVTPTIVVPTNGYVTAQGNQLVRGKAAPGSTVVLKDGSTVIGTVTADASGNWSYAPAAPFTTGTHLLTATQILASGVRTVSSTTVLTVLPAAGVGPVITGPIDGTVTPNTTPRFNGTAAPGATVTLRTLEGTVLGTAVAVASAADPAVGTWVITSGVDLPVGSTTVVATQVRAGVSRTSNTTSVTVDPNAPMPVEIDLPLDLTVTSDGTEDVHGTGEPGGYVKLLTNDPEDAKYPGVFVDGNGRWRFQGVTFSSGVNYVYATQDIEWSTGQVSTMSGRAKDPATRSRGVQLLSSSRQAVLLADAPAIMSSTSQTVRVLREAAETTAIAKPVITAPTEGQVLAGNRPTITGTGEPGATITVLDDAGNVLGVALVAADGSWSLVPATALAAGTVSIRAVETLADGTAVGATEVRTFVVPLLSGGAPLPTDSPTAPVTVGNPVPTVPATAPGATPGTAPGTAPGTTTTAAPTTGSATGVKAPTGSGTTVRASTGAAGPAARTTAKTTAAKLSKLAHTGADLAPLLLGIVLLVSGLGAILAAQRGRVRAGRPRPSTVQAPLTARAARVQTRTISLHSNASDQHSGGPVAVLERVRPQAGDGPGVEVVAGNRGSRAAPPRPRWNEADALAGMPLLGSGPPGPGSRERPRGRPGDHLPPARGTTARKRRR